MLKEIILMACALGICSAGVILIPRGIVEKALADARIQDLETAESAQIGYGGYQEGYGGYNPGFGFGGVPGGYGAYGGQQQEVVQGSLGIPGLGGISAEFGERGGGLIL